MREVQTFPNGPLLFDHCSKFGFEGVVSKRISSRYVSGPSRSWIKSKCANWRRANVNRGKLFERPQKPALTEGQRTLVKKWVELAQVQEQLRDHDYADGRRYYTRTYYDRTKYYDDDRRRRDDDYRDRRLSERYDNRDCQATRDGRVKCYD